MQPLVGRALLDRKLVQRQVLGRVADSLLQLPRPSRRRLTWAGVDEVEGEALEGGAGDGNCRQRLFGRVHAPELAEIGVVESLHTEGDAVDAGGPEAAEPLRL